MEITEILRRAGRRLWLLAVIPLLGVGAVLGLGLSGDEKPHYQAIATVVVTPPTGADSAAAVAQAVDGFRSALTAQMVLESASRATDVPVGEIRSDVSSRRIGASNIIEVTYSGPRHDKAAELLTAQATQAQTLLFSPALAAAKREHTATKEAYDKAADDLSKLRKETGLILPSEDYRAAAAEVTQLKVALVQGDARLTGTGPIRSALTEAEEELDDLANKVRSFEDVQFAVDSTRAGVTSVEGELVSTQARLDAARSGDSLKVGAVVEQARTAPLVRSAVTAAVVGLVLAFLLLVLLEVARPRRRSTSDPVAGAAYAGSKARIARPERSEADAAPSDADALSGASGGRF
jgi:hypothetical protein